MNTIRVTQAEFERAFGVFADKAKQEPVTITRGGRDDLVVLSAEEYARLKRRDRRVFATEDATDDQIAAVEASRMDQRHNHLDADLKLAWSMTP